ncbi:MAG: tetratricopeptide repeat protein [Candidatus Eremiobacteraeota bacterium]|nr:tetratricopeptide repeat protein [Candidatus Eremiobacteraeota bacterium]
MITLNSLRRLSLLALAVLLPVAAGGCAGPVERWIVNTRDNQGAVALTRGNLHEAALAYRLALRVDPNDARARAGFSAVSLDIANTDYRKGNFDDAKATLNAAAKYDPGSVRLQALRSAIDQAKLKREIVIANYPTYAAAGESIVKSFAGFNAQNKLILRSIKRFGYTYDTTDLTSAIDQSYEMQLDIAKNTNRLIAFRQLVNSGVPEPRKGATASAGAASLLPLP